MPHVDIHECRPTKKILRLGRNNRDLMIAQFSYPSGSGDSRNSVSDDYYMFQGSSKFWFKKYLTKRKDLIKQNIGRAIIRFEIDV